MYGYYTPLNGRVNVYRFVTDNFLNICALFLPEPPIAYVGNGQKFLWPTNKKPHNDSVASVLAFEVTNDTTGQKIKQYRLIIDTQAVDFKEMIGKMPAQEFLLALWEVVFHEARHVVQLQLFDHERKDQLRFGDLNQIGRLNSDLVQWIKQKMATCQENGYTKRRMEYDAIVIESIAYLNLVYDLNRGQVNLKRLLHLLVLSRREIMARLSYFIPRETPDNPPLKIAFDFELQHDPMIIGLNSVK
ncbi:TPA: hypothetical protein DF272_01785 [Candidatus Falkowbacteria bacterium]|nr:hypothetical protein [Candidatus Falkowbacteria bacterium]